MKKILSSVRVSEKTHDNMKQAIKKYNSKNLVPMSENDFRRYAYELLSKMIIEELELPQLRL